MERFHPGSKVKRARTRPNAWPGKFAKGKRAYPSQRRAWRSWVNGSADALTDLGHGGKARRLRECGGESWVRGCTESECGEGIAKVITWTSCDLRICPLCARAASTRKAEQLTDAVGRVDAIEWSAEAIETKRAAWREEREERERIASDWRAKVKRYDERGLTDDPRRARALRLAESAEDDVKRLERWWHDAKRRPSGGWRWRLLTVTLPWDPSDPNESTPQRIAERVEALFAAWGAIWEQISVGGLASAYAKAEISTHGHIHLHALYFGPWIKAEWLTELSQRSGAGFADARMVGASTHENDTQAEQEAAHCERGHRLDPAAARREAARRRRAGAIREVAKYTCKAPSPTDAAWLAGEARPVIHPALAAAWVVGTEGTQLARMYGELRDVWSDDEVLERVEKVHHCRACGCALPSIVLGGWTKRATTSLASLFVASRGRTTWETDSWKRVHAIEQAPDT